MTSPPAAAASDAPTPREGAMSASVNTSTSLALPSATPQSQQQKSCTSGQSRQIDAGVDSKLREIVGSDGPDTHNARQIQEQIAQDPYEAVRRGLKELTEMATENESKQAGGSVAGESVVRDTEVQQTLQESETKEGEQELRDHSAMARDLDMLAETVRSIVHQVAQPEAAEEERSTSAQISTQAQTAAKKQISTLNGVQGGYGIVAATGGTSTKPSRVEYSKELRQTCVVLHASGFTYRQIAEQLSMPTPSVQSIVRRSAGTSTSTTTATSDTLPRRRAGRPRAITEAMEQRIMALVRSDLRVSPRVVLKTLGKEYPGLGVSFETIRRRVQHCRSQLNARPDQLSGEPGGSPALSAAADSSAAASSTKRHPSIAAGQKPKQKKPRGAEYSHETRAQCVHRHEVEGASYATIAKEMDMPQDSVRSIVRKAKRTGSVSSAPRSGRPRKTSGIVDKVILQAVKTNERCSAKAIQEELQRVFGVKVSSETVRRRVVAHTKQRLMAISTGVTTHPAEEKEPSTSASATAAQRESTVDVSSSVTIPETANAVLANSVSFQQLLHQERSVDAIDTAGITALSPPLVDVEPPTDVPTSQETSTHSSVVAAPETQVQAFALQQNVAVAAATSAPAPKKRRAKRGEYSVTMREQCVALHAQGYGYRRIGKTLDMPHTTVRAIVEKVQRTGSVLPAPRSGRPRKTDEIVDKVILQAVKANEKSSARLIQEQLLAAYDVRVSCETIRRRVKDHSRQCLSQAAASSTVVTPPPLAAPRPATSQQEEILSGAVMMAERGIV